MTDLDGPTGPESSPPPLERPEPYFTSSRRTRGRGPGRGPVVASLFAIVLIGGAVAFWLQRGGGGSNDALSDAAVAESLSVAGDSLAADGGDVAAEASDADTAGGAVSPEAAAGAGAALDTTPVAPPTPVARLSLSVEPAAATVTVDDSLQASPDSALLLSLGPHRVVAEADGYVTVDTVVELAADTAVTLGLRRSTGTLTVRANLSGRVFVDGRDRGAAPVSGLRLRPGTYTVRFVPEGADALAEQRRVTVRAGEASSAAFEVTDALLSVSVRSPRWASVYSGDLKLGDTPLIDRRVPARAYTLRLDREGYVAQERLVRLQPGQRFQWVDVVLQEEGP